MFVVLITHKDVSSHSFSITKLIKSNNRSRFTDSNLNGLMILIRPTTNLQAYIEKLASNIKTQNHI